MLIFFISKRFREYGVLQQWSGTFYTDCQKKLSIPIFKSLVLLKHLNQITLRKIHHIAYVLCKLCISAERQSHKKCY